MRTLTNRALLLAALALGSVVPVLGQTPYSEIWTANVQRSYKLAPTSTVIVDNRMGNVVIEGVGGNTLDLRAKLTVRGVDEAAIREARESVRIHANPTPHGRMIRTAGNEPNSQRWAALVDYYLRIPRTCNVAITTVSSDYVQIIDITGSLQIRNFSGKIDIAATGSPMVVDTTNGDIVVRLKGSPREDSRLTTLNGTVQVYSRSDLAFQWIAESMNGKVSLSRNLPIDLNRPDANRNRWVAELNGGGKRIYSASMTGQLLLGPLQDAPSEVNPGLERTRTRPSQAVPDTDEIIEIVSRFLLQRPGARNFAFKQNRVPDALRFETRIGNVVAVEVNDATVTTGAGEIIIGRARGSLEATTYGGPINVGETFDTVELETSAGDIMINAANAGGHAKTGGGNIRIRRSGGPLRLFSGGGDITVNECHDNVIAHTKSGDVNVTVHPSVRSLSLDLKTTGGNVIVMIPPGLRASVEATVISSDSDNYTIDSTVSGLAIVRDVVGDKNRTRARGTLNGGGPILKIIAEDGNIQLRQSPPK